MLRCVPKQNLWQRGQIGRIITTRQRLKAILRRYAVEGPRLWLVEGAVQSEGVPMASRARSTIVARKIKKYPLGREFQLCSSILTKNYTERPQIGPEPTRGPVCRTQLRREGRAPFPAARAGHADAAGELPVPCECRHTASNRSQSGVCLKWRHFLARGRCGPRPCVSLSDSQPGRAGGHSLAFFSLQPCGSS